MGEFVVVSQFTIFLLELLGSAEKPMAAPSDSKRKIMSWDEFQIIGGKNKWHLHNLLTKHKTQILGKVNAYDNT